MADTERVDTVIVGGGLAGLTAAAYLARHGASVALFEKASELGGRAGTQDDNGFKLNYGPHALYRGCEGMEVLRELGVTFTGKSPSPSGAYTLLGGRKHALPSGPVSLLMTSLLGVAGKVEVARLLGSLQKLDAEAAMSIDVATWLRDNIRDATARSLVQALFRLTTYANAPSEQGAGPALRQLQLALSKNVLYLDGGWRTLVEGLRAKAVAAGAVIQGGSRVSAIRCDGNSVAAVELGDGRSIATSAVIIAGSPRDAATLAPKGTDTPLQQWADNAIPVRAACLDLGLRRLPQPRARFAIGLDQPLYLSVHSASAELAAPGTALIQVAKYLPCGRDSDAHQDRRELEGAMDLVQPGWREHVVTQRYLPNLTVAHALVTPAMGGYRGRPTAAVPGVSGLFVAGDWVGPEGWLADASLASGRQAALAASAQPVRLRSAA